MCDECKQEAKIDIIHELLTEVRQDIKDILSFKYKLLGVLIFVSFIVGVLIDIVRR
jgi:hypothetical protein